MSTPTAPEPEIVPGTSRPIPVDPDVVPEPQPERPEPQIEPDRQVELAAHDLLQELDAAAGHQV